MKKLVREVNECFTISWEEAMEGFLYWKQAQGVSECTFGDYLCKKITSL